jgi:hypothetical protein
MIVTLAQDVCEQLEEIGQLEDSIHNEGAVKATLDILTKVFEATQQLQVLLTLHRARLLSDELQHFIFIVEEYIEEIKTSEQNFANNPRQTQALNALLSRIQKLTKKIKEQWRLYAIAQTQQLFELLKLVLPLPEVQAQQHIFIDLQGKLTKFFDYPPDSVYALAEFDQALQELRELLSQIEGLSTGVRAFLQKTLDGQATLADLTDEVLQWCREGEHAKVFVVRFIQ